jgi:thioredoxin 1
MESDQMSDNHVSMPAPENIIDTPIVVTDDTINEFIDTYPIVVLDCHAEWCGPCKMLSPLIDKLAKEYAGKVVFVKLDIDKNPETSKLHDIQAVPTILIFMEHEFFSGISGLPSETELKQEIESSLVEQKE